MKLGMVFVYGAVIACCLATTGCVPVKSWEKAAFAKEHMSFDPDPLESKLVRHMQESKEGASGGYGVSVVGCGCN